MENRKLLSVMALHGDTYESLSEFLGIHRVTLSKKIQGKADFTQTEMSKIKERYKLSNEDFALMFTMEGANNDENQRSIEAT